ncbi:GH1 family beta-glucosidase [Alicyclobacillus pomorum]|uniref:GH1 family beta-glucosidase n=1 Tax=Alicyclobacillus pomorum TaxID=204470 RepID=UPI00041F8A68|nr:GH1 family beta-glucosidase [Alicyclobacillus pomorum]
MAKFPEHFLFGAATAAYQVEGAAGEDGRGPSIWDVFSHTPGKVVNGETGDVACDHYHRHREDVALMKELGIHSYRFSIAWPRLFPHGTGALNEKGLDFYQRLVEELLKHDITPMATLYHWDLPQALQDKGGWANRDTADAFAAYADTVFRRLGDKIPMFITLNEPWCSAVLGHAVGVHAPGDTDYGKALAAAHHLLLGHGKAVQAFRQSGAVGKVGLTNILSHIVPASDDPDDVAAASRMDALTNRWFLLPIFQATYPTELRALGVDQFTKDGDLALMSQPIDFLGVNYYFEHRVKANPADPIIQATVLEPTGDLTAMGWGISPNGLRDVLLRIRRDYGDIPMYVTENGAAFHDVVEGDIVHDAPRISYLRRHLLAVREAMDAGVDVRGYYVWSLMDNFEWHQGYAKRFGLFYVDYPTQRRLWKDSARWYQNVTASREVQ